MPPKYLKKKGTGQVFVWSEILAKRPDMVAYQGETEKNLLYNKTDEQLKQEIGNEREEEVKAEAETVEPKGGVEEDDVFEKEVQRKRQGKVNIKQQRAVKRGVK